MAWLTGKKRAEEKAARLQTEREEASRRNEQKAAVIDASSKKEHMKKLSDELALIQKFPHRTEYISNAMKTLSSSFDIIDLSCLSLVSKVRVYDVVYIKLPKACATYKTSYLSAFYPPTADGDAWMATVPGYGCYVRDLFRTMVTIMEEVRMSQNEIQIDQQKALPQTTQQEHQLSSELHGTVKKLLRDDNFSKQFYRLDTLIKRINSNSGNTVEDSHFLEQVVKEYIPGAISLYALFLDADEARKSKARDNLKEQFDLIEDKLMDMASKVLDRDLAQFETKTSFLRTKMEDEKLAAAPARKALNA